MSADYTKAFAVLHEDTLRRVEQAARDLTDLERELGGGVGQRSTRTFIAALQLMTETTRSVLEEVAERFEQASETPPSDGPDPDFDPAGSAYMELNTLAEFMNHRLEMEVQELRLPRTEELEVFATPFARLAKRLIPNAEVLFVPSLTKDGYRVDIYDSERVGKIDPTLGDNLSRTFGADIKFLRFRHPASRRTDLFEHAVFAHEVAHALIVQPLRDGPLEDQAGPEGSEATEDHAPEQRTFQTAATDHANETHPIDDDGLARLQRWFVELACDIVAFRLIGPAFLVAFCEVTALNRGIHKSPNRHGHPTPVVRFEYFSEELERFVTSASSRPAERALTAYLESHKGTEQNAEQLTTHEGNWLRAAVENFRECLPRMLGELALDPNQLRDDYERVAALAKRRIPPAERVLVGTASHDDDLTWSSELDWRSIVNGILMWHLACCGPPGVQRDESREDHRRRSVELAAAAIELAEFQREASSLRQQYGDMFVDRAALR